MDKHLRDCLGFVIGSNGVWEAALLRSSARACQGMELLMALTREGKELQTACLAGCPASPAVGLATASTCKHIDASWLIGSLLTLSVKMSKSLEKGMSQKKKCMWLRQ